MDLPATNSSTFRRRKTYTATDKLQVVARAEEVGNNRQVAKELGLSEANIRLWRKHKLDLEKDEQLTEKPKRKRQRLCKCPSLETELKKWILDSRAKKMKVTNVTIQLKARSIASRDGIKDFNASNGWVHKFLKRANIDPGTGFNKSAGQDSLIPKDNIKIEIKQEPEEESY